MVSLRIILWDQLSYDISSLKDCNKENDIIMMFESLDNSMYVKHHKKKLVFLFSAMRHFATDLKKLGYKLEYFKIDDNVENKSMKDQIHQYFMSNDVDQIIFTKPSDYDTYIKIKSWKNEFKIPIEIREDDRFLCSKEEFLSWANNKKHLRMEFFYREMRKKYSILMDRNNPIGGKWNFDSDNRNSPIKNLNIPTPYYNETDDITKEVIELVEDLFANHFGDIYPFYYAVSREGALKALENFIDIRLNQFGEYQDAMIQDEPWIFHSHISFYLNCGLLSPLECIKSAEKAYYMNKAPLNSVEGFIRQILGWREYIRGVYWLRMPEYKYENFLNANRKLPELYWIGNSRMNCLNQCIIETKKNAYAHHIQRLMVLGNFALITGVKPEYVNEWFLIVYADAYEWVELPNVTGMILFADGGYLGSKPYAAGGAYINKMSDYCKNCSYKVVEKNGKDACPFNYLYWNFLATNRNKLESNARINMVYKTYKRMKDPKKKMISEDSKKFC
jgi:deoxyribodipyrimidine photolyase-related protein